jgi:hypothetical protein
VIVDGGVSSAMQWACSLAMTEFRDAKIGWDVIGYVAVHRADFVGKVPSLTTLCI